MSPDRNLLFGILALQNAFITRDQLVEAMNAWVIARHQPLGELLRERGLREEEHALLEALVNRQLAQHQGDVEKSLHALEVSSSARQALATVADADVQASLACLDTTSPDPTTDHVSPPGAEGLRYRVLRPHARGGLGEVFVAFDTELHREVALKEIQSQHADNPGSRGRFLLEAEITGRLEHPGIVPVYGLGHHADGRPFYAMRFIKGDNLKHAIDRFHASKAGFDTLAFRQVLRRFLDVGNAVAYAHARGVLHRDLKPGNVMLGEYGETLLVDWGLAKVVGHSEPKEGETALRLSSGSDVVETVAGTVIGTPAYMSPEQAEGKLEALGPATDVYSLGATLYCLLTGRAPVPQGHVAEVLEKVRRGDIPPANQVRPGVPKAVAAICRKAMALAPGERYSSALALVADVEHWLADEPVSAYREPLYGRVGRWARKHRTLVTSAGTMLLMAVVALSVGMVTVGGLNRRLESANVDLKESNEKLEVARTDAEEKRREAEQERSIAKAVTAFLQTDLLGQADISNQPFQGVTGERNPNITVADLLERAAKSLEGKFPDQPETEGAIRLTIGDAYRALGSPQLAQPHLERSLALRLQKLGEDHVHTLESRNRLALLYFTQGKFDKAEPLCLEVVRLREKTLGAEHSETLVSKHNLTQLYLRQGKFAQAEPLCVELVRQIEKKQGPDHPDTLGGKHTLALLYLNLRQFDKAEPLCVEVARLREKIQGVDHPDTLTAKHNLAGLYQAQGQYDKAEPLCLEVLRLREKRLGVDHPHTLTSKNVLALVFVNQEKFEQAEPLYLEVLQLREKKLGVDHPDTLITKNNLAWMYYAQKKYDKAEPLYLEVLRPREKALGPLHPNTLTTKYNLSLLYQARGDYKKAEPLAEQAVTGGIKTLGFGHPTTQASIRDLAILYERLKTPEKAQPILQQQLDFLQARPGAESLDTAEARVELGTNLVRLKRYAEAEPHLVQGYEGLEKRAPKIPPQGRVRLKEALDRLVQLYDATGNKDEAAKWRTKLDEEKAAAKEGAKK